MPSSDQDENQPAPDVEAPPQSPLPPSPERLGGSAPDARKVFRLIGLIAFGTLVLCTVIPVSTARRDAARRMERRETRIGNRQVGHLSDSNWGYRPNPFGKTARLILDADALWLASLDPDSNPIVEYGRVEIRDLATRRRLVKLLWKAVDEATGAAMCFRPHHALIARKGNSEEKIEICFTCAKLCGVDMGGCSYITREPMSAFDELLTAAGIPLGNR